MGFSDVPITIGTSTPKLEWLNLWYQRTVRDLKPALEPPHMYKAQTIAALKEQVRLVDLELNRLAEDP